MLAKRMCVSSSGDEAAVVFAVVVAVVVVGVVVAVVAVVDDDVEDDDVELRAFDDDEPDDKLPVELRLSLHAAISSAMRSLETRHVPMCASAKVRAKISHASPRDPFEDWLLV